MIELTDSEKIVMKCAWECGEGFQLSQVQEMARERYERDWKIQTVSTFLSKLIQKGVLEKYRSGRYFHYHILVDKRTYRSRMLREDLTFWEDDNVEELMEELCDPHFFTAAERRRMKKYFQKQ